MHASHEFDVNCSFALVLSLICARLIFFFKMVIDEMRVVSIYSCTSFLNLSSVNVFVFVIPSSSQLSDYGVGLASPSH